MALLSSDDEDADAARSLEAEGRELPLVIRTEVALKTGAAGPEARSVKQMEVQVRDQVGKMLTSSGRAPIAGPVALSIQIAVPPARNRAGVRRVTKSYIDVLKDSAFGDDENVRHLIVWATTHEEPGAHVTAQILPLDLFEADYDRAFRLLGHDGALASVLPGVTLSTATMRNGAPIPKDELPPWGLLPFTSADRELLEAHRNTLRELLEMDADEDAWEGDPDDWSPCGRVQTRDPEFDDPDVRASTRDYLHGLVATELGREVTENGFGAGDRTGRINWLGRLVADVDVLQLSDQGPGCFTVVAPPGTTYKSWAKAVGNDVASAFRTGRWSSASFDGNVVIDIAVPVTTPAGDLDNVGGFVFSAVEEALGKTRGERLVGFRAYRQCRDTSIRVRLLPAIRLEALQRAMAIAREAATRPPRRT